MKYILPFLIVLLFSCTDSNQSTITLTVEGLEKPVEIIRDEYGVNHIYAQSEHDLFFAQGYCAARDRLFQFELWRRKASGTMAELFGERELKRDIGARLFKYKGDLKKEFNHYHPRGKEIIYSFTDGINAYVKETENNPDLLTLEFKLLGITAGRWTPDLVISRHQGLLGNLPDELATGRAVALLGAKQVLTLKVFEPGQPDITIDPAIDQQGLFENVTELYDAFRRPFIFLPEDLVSPSVEVAENFSLLQHKDNLAYEKEFTSEKSIGSNNWVISGSHSKSGSPLLANDPHRAVAAPSLRYMVHLNAPGWNVLGGGEPTIPGVSIGHNDYGAWGLTVFETDGEDLMVYQLNPKNLNQYKYNNGWEEMTTLNDTISVKNSSDVVVEHKYTRHGPVSFINHKRNIAYAIRCAWLEPGAAPYLASLRMNVAKNWEEFRDACSYSHIPGENMIWADKKGNIGWQAVGISPIRKNWSGLVPIPGDGRYEWDGYLPIKSLPSILNPDQGYWATANACTLPNGYPFRNAVGWEWSDSSRITRINEVLTSKNNHTQEDMTRLQVDYFSVPARQLVPLLQNIVTEDNEINRAKEILSQWDYVLDKKSVAAGIYVGWERALTKRAHEIFVPENARGVITTVWLKKVIGWIKEDKPELNGRDQFLISCLQDALYQLRQKLGNDMNQWQYGQEDYHHALIKHPLSNVLGDSLRKIFECGPLPRGGNGFTPGATSTNDNQSSGATFRMVVDVGDWDKTLFSNAPGQSGDINSPFYNNLFSLWAEDKFFPVYFSKAKIKGSARETLKLNP